MDDACSTLTLHTSGLMRSFRAGATIRRWRDQDSSLALDRCVSHDKQHEQSTYSYNVWTQEPHSLGSNVWMDKVSPSRHDGMGHGRVRTNKPIESCSNNDKDGSQLLMDRCFLPEFPAPYAKFHGSEYRFGEDRAKSGAQRDAEYRPQRLKV